MKTSIGILTIIFFFSLQGQGQSLIDALMTIKPSKITQYKTSEVEGNVFFVEMGFGSANILNEAEAREYLADKKPIRVELVYTDFSRSSSFNQPALNKERFKALFDLNKAAFSELDILWQVTAQTGLRSITKGKQFFHGFAIYFESEDSSLDKLISIKNNEEFVDSTVLNALVRNKDWKKMLVVADLTGSMTPYTAQVLIWLRLNQKRKLAQHFTFFNDGDDKADESKEIGKTGGIYHSDGTDFREILGLAKKTMEGGYGGDDPENDVEAILEGLKACPTCEDIVLIADNYSTMRDYSLIETIGKPVKVIICSNTQDWVSEEYLNLALKTKGSIHTLEEDITDLMKLNEGEILTIGKFKYIIKKGEFKLLGGS